MSQNVCQWCGAYHASIHDCPKSPEPLSPAVTKAMARFEKRYAEGREKTKREIDALGPPVFDRNPEQGSAPDCCLCCPVRCTQDHSNGFNHADDCRASERR